MQKAIRPKRSTFRDNYLAVLLGAAALLLSAASVNAQIIQNPNPGNFGTKVHRLVPDSASYFTTACGVPTDSTFLFSQGFNGNGEKGKWAAKYYDSCGHHEYTWDPSLKAWHIVDSSIAAPNLQSVTDSGNSTSNAIRIVTAPGGSTEVATLFHNSDTQGELDLENGVGGATRYQMDSIVYRDSTLRYPHKSGTFALTSDTVPLSTRINQKRDLADSNKTDNSTASIGRLNKKGDSVTHIIDTMRSSLYNGLDGKMNNYGGAPGHLQGTYALIPLATGYPTGTQYVARDSGFMFVDTGAGGSRGWKLIRALPSGPAGGALNGNYPNPGFDTTGQNIHTAGYNDKRYITDRAQLGVLHSANSWSSLTGYVNTATISTSTPLSNKLNFSGGAGTYTQTLTTPEWHYYEHWSVAAKVRINSSTATAYGIGVGMLSKNTLFPVSVLGTLSFTNDGNAGLSSVTTVQAGASTVMRTSASNLSFSVNDYIIIVTERIADSIQVRVKNFTTNSAWITTTYLYTLDGSVTPQVPNTGQFGIFSLGGTFTVDSLSITSTEQAKPDYYIIGDSKTAGAKVSAWKYRFSDLFTALYPNTVNLGGNADRLIELRIRLADILSHPPKYGVIFNMGSNDTRTSGSVPATVYALYDSVVNVLTTAGIRVIHLLTFYETAQDNLPLVNHILATFSANDIIDTYWPLRTTASCINADGIHPNETGHYIIFKSMMTSGLFSGGYSTYSELIKRLLPNVTGVTGTIANGQVAFGNSTAIAGTNDLTWDNTNFRLKVGQSTPLIAGSINSAGTVNGGRIIGVDNLNTGTSAYAGVYAANNLGDYGVFAQYGSNYSNATFAGATGFTANKKFVWASDIGVGSGGTNGMLFYTGGNSVTTPSFSLVNGSAKFGLYGGGTHTGTLAYGLGVTSTGDVIEFAPGMTNPMTTIGDIIYGGSSGAATRLAGNTTTTRKFYVSTGTGSAAQAPTIDVLQSGDIPNNAANTTGSAGSLSAASTLPAGTVIAHVGGTGSAPSQTSLGTNVTSITITGNDSWFSITVVTSGAVAGTIGTIGYAATWSSIPVVVISSANYATANGSSAVICNATSTSSMTMAGTIPVAGTYVFNCHSGN